MFAQVLQLRSGDDRSVHQVRLRLSWGVVNLFQNPALISFTLVYRYFEEFIIAPMIMCVVWLGVCIAVLCPSKRSSGSKGVPLLVQERCKKAARFGALGRALSKLGLGLALVAVLGEAEGAGRGLAARCGLGSGTVGWYEGLVFPETTGIRLQTASGTLSFDSNGQVQGRLEVKVGNFWMTIAGFSNSFGGTGSSGGEAESTVACRQLGNELGYTLVSASKVGREDTDDGSGMAYKVTCAGTESTLDSCTSFAPWGSVNHHFDVGVSCTFIAPGDECEECVAGKFSDTTGVAACTSCAAGSYSAVVGSVSATDCQQVRVEGGRSDHKEFMSNQLPRCSAMAARRARQAARQAPPA
jgi:hypothetical protein